MSIQDQLNKANILITEFKSLRKLQKEYFRYRDTATLDKCKLQERKIDNLLDDYDNTKNMGLIEGFSK